MTKRQAACIRFIRQRRTYTVKELAKLLGVHARTVQQWHTEGLAALEESHPLLFLGEVTTDFLKARSADRKLELGPGEYLCMRCRQSRPAEPQSQEVKATGKRIGRDKELVLLCGDCVQCGCKMVRIASQPIQNESSSAMRPKQA